MTQPLRVVHVSDCFPPRVGGIETQVHDLAAEQARAGYDIHVLTATADPALPNGRRAESTTADGVTVHRFASAATFGLPFHPLEDVLLPPVLRELVPDVVHVHAGVVSPFAYAGARAARRAGLPLAITWHCMLDGVTPFYRTGARVLGWNRASLAASAVSGVAAERVAQVLGREPDEVAVVPNGLDVAAWLPAATAPEASRRGPLPPSGPLRVVATQRLAPRKRALPLVRVLARVHERLGRDDAGRPRVQLELVGSGPEERAVRSEVSRRGLQDVVTVAGRLPRGRLAARYRERHVFLAPARLEAFGIAALEARATGLAVVAGRGTGISQFVTDGVDGLLTSDRADGLDDAAADEALADALVRLATEEGLLAGILAHNAAVPPAADWSDVVAAADALYGKARSRTDRSGLL
ncbi:glycosyltransferase family 4 protein [Georgenia halophila]|uniref:D-inositol 3-phosphate glycosyltransferase n=1 Tax=Georgenia halophila TaxID=620889 RepID=A0ABP8KWV2_9MICO